MDSYDLIMKYFDNVKRETIFNHTSFLNIKCKNEQEIISIMKAFHKLGLRWCEDIQLNNQEHFKRKVEKNTISSIKNTFVYLNWRTIQRKHRYAIEMTYVPTSIYIEFDKAIKILKEIRKELRNG